jgi:hypothetical protein
VCDQSLIVTPWKLKLATHRIFDLQETRRRRFDYWSTQHCKMRTKLQSSDLKSVLVSITKRQNLLAVVPPALRALPIAALFCADYLDRKLGWNSSKLFLAPPNPTPIELAATSLPAPHPRERRQKLDRRMFGETALASAKYLLRKRRGQRPLRFLRYEKLPRYTGRRFRPLAIKLWSRRRLSAKGTFFGIQNGLHQGRAQKQPVFHHASSPT